MKPTPRLLLAGLLLSLLPPAALAAPPTFPEGLWTLVHQSYGRGEANLAKPDRPLRLEFAREGTGLSARTWVGDERTEARSWPAWVVEGEALPLEIKRWDVASAAGTVTVRYQVQPSESGTTILDVVEAYHLDKESQELVGTVTVTFLADGEERGSYVLHRRFERHP
jgi:hypothetical protein